MRAAERREAAAALLALNVATAGAAAPYGDRPIKDLRAILVKQLEGK